MADMPSRLQIRLSNAEVELGKIKQEVKEMEEWEVIRCAQLDAALAENAKLRKEVAALKHKHRAIEWVENSDGMYVEKGVE